MQAIFDRDSAGSFFHCLLESFQFCEFLQFLAVRKCAQSIKSMRIRDKVIGFPRGNKQFDAKITSSNLIHSFWRDDIDAPVIENRFGPLCRCCSLSDPSLQKTVATPTVAKVFRPLLAFVY